MGSSNGDVFCCNAGVRKCALNDATRCPPTCRQVEDNRTRCAHSKFVEPDPSQTLVGNFSNPTAHQMPWAAYSLLLRQRPADLPQNVALAASIAAALAMLIPLLIISSATNIAELASVPTLAGIGYVAIFASVIAFLFWSYGVSQLGPSRAGQFINLMPIFGAALAFTLLGETPVPSQIIGAALVLAGIVLVERRPKRH